DGSSVMFRGNHSIIVRDTKSGAQHFMFQHPEANGVLCFSPEGRRAIVMRTVGENLSDKIVALGEIVDPPRLVELPEVGRDVSCAAISRDGRRAITADYEHDLMLWDLDRTATGPVDDGPEWQGLTFAGWSKNGRCAIFGIDRPQPLAW